MLFAPLSDLHTESLPFSSCHKRHPHVTLVLAVVLCTWYISIERHTTTPDDTFKIMLKLYNLVCSEDLSWLLPSCSVPSMHNACLFQTQKGLEDSIWLVGLM